MPTVDFIDYVKLYVRAGKGGAGSVHFRREKSVPKGGPDGGDGGRGGHIILQGNAQLSTLLHLCYRKHITAENGQPGGGGARYGATGVDAIVEVPLGTVVKKADTDQVLLEIVQEGAPVVLMEGGQGGLGNTHFKSATRQTPRYAQPGKPGDEGWIDLELKLLADAGLVGLPNAGKSTLLSVVSAAKPKIATYPFTTLVPQLGVVGHREQQSFVMADIPGIIKGASVGKGLGTRFLRHVARNSVLLFVISADDTPAIDQTYHTLIQELRAHSPTLLDKPRLLVISKIDLITPARRSALSSRLPSSIDHVWISSLTGEGLGAMKDKIWKLLHIDH